MYLSHNLLCSFVSEFKNIKIADLNNACNNLGIEIERILTHPKLTNLVVGQIVSLSKVTGSNHLSLVGVQVNQNSSELKKIICGASNLQINQKVVVALNGCRLYDGRIITKKSLLGIESEGMICSYKELTPLWHDLLDRDNANGIISLDNDAPVGETNISSLLGLDDTIFELTLPTNRHD
jgi:phenylalanyl-tRNA synthetase beta chain